MDGFGFGRSALCVWYGSDLRRRQQSLLFLTVSTKNNARGFAIAENCQEIARAARFHHVSERRSPYGSRGVLFQPGKGFMLHSPS